MITVERLREVLAYDPCSGVFTWRVKLNSRAPAGNIAGYSMRAGYRLIRIDTRRYLAHRLAWLYVHGRWPDEQIDHISRDRGDNRIANLRLATVSQNGANVAAGARNTSGFKGVCRRSDRRFEANIQVQGRPIYLGQFDTAEQANAVYQAAAREYFGEFAA